MTAIGNVRLSSALPAIIVPVNAPRLRGLVEQTRAASANSDVDIIEWRADALLSHASLTRARDALAAITAEAGDTPVLVTVRTSAEGGDITCGPARYLDLCLSLVRQRPAAIDVEISQPHADEVIAAAREKGVVAVASRHDFAGTMASAEWARELALMRELGADVAKLAVTTATPKAARRFLDAIEDYVADTQSLPLIAAGMGNEGPLVRAWAPSAGAQATFASFDAVTAPGQIDARVLAALWRACGRRASA